MKVKVANASSIKTRNRIKASFITLMKEKKNLSKITVTELVAIADITRGTFYTHYDSIYDVADEFWLDTLETCFKNMESIHSINDIDIFFDNIFYYLKENEETYKILLQSDEPLLFINRLNKKIFNHVIKYFSVPEPNLELNISFFLDGTLSLILKYFKGEIHLSLDEINSYIKNMFKKMFVS